MWGTGEEEATMPRDVRSLLSTLETRYGRTVALAIGLAAIALVVVPLPGLVFLPVGVAELLVRVTGRRPVAAAGPARAKA
jgi:hypothetical protein